MLGIWVCFAKVVTLLPLCVATAPHPGRLESPRRDCRVGLHRHHPLAAARLSHAVLAGVEIFDSGFMNQVDLVTGELNLVPEPSTILLLATSLTGLGVAT